MTDTVARLTVADEAIDPTQEWHKTACGLCSCNKDRLTTPLRRRPDFHRSEEDMVDADWRDGITGTPWHKHVPARVEPIPA